MPRRFAALGIALLSLVPFQPRPAAAQSFPDRPIRIVVPINPGGGTDIFARVLQEIVGSSLGQPIIVENRPGASGTIGVQHVIDSRPDGHTLGFIWNTPITAAPHTLGARYTIDQMAPVFTVGYSPFALCAKPDFPARSLPEMIAKIRENPNTYTWGNEGLGGVMHLGVERILRRLDLQMTTVPFQGAGQTLPAFLGGHITFYGGSIVGAMPAIRANSARCLLLTTREGHPAAPDGAGLDSLGLGDMAVTIWWGMIAPVGIPADRMARLNEAFGAAMRTPRFREAMDAQGATLAPLFGDEMGRAMRAEYEALGEVARTLGLSRPPAR
ncbi:tripartite tricarboxylate transporter substrate binding protein [Roseococcus sp. SYP-B2431]|uniref:Bug family tripartite tricarboxylate transporter substrate binding protein n=1 Tax=Roseococcus sp. SYP-B2431 TaxID=2496640 RepID=UPI001040AB42|nr:tripartite tricarboxylate transporter substrate binding protein [Roseococcus sp. SYP-B2431]TCH99492.1 tripartite tricarboxylate transporter substrate binding protein [Roseococcus sp. SYP-B2431]